MKLLTPTEASEILKVHINTIYNWIQSGEIKATKFGDMWRIDEAEIQNRLKGNGDKE